MVTLIRELPIDKTKVKLDYVQSNSSVQDSKDSTVVTVCKCEGKGAGAYSHSLQVALSAVFAP